MPSYNHEKFIAESIESVLGQKFDDFELIIVDDASIDSSRQIIQKYGADDSRIRVILHETNCGIAKTANDGIAAATGKFLALIASDDVWMKDKLSKQLAVTTSNENLVVWSNGEVIDDQGRPIGKNWNDLYGTPKTRRDIFEELLRENYIFGSTLLYKRMNQGEIRFDESLAYNNDFKFYLEMARRYDFCYIAEPLAQYRIHTKNTLLGSDSEGLKRRRRAYREEIAVRQDAMQRYGHAISNTTKAEVYAKMRFVYEALGENKAAIFCFLRAIWYNPFSRSNLLGTPRFLKLMFLNLLNKRTEAHFYEPIE